MVRCHWSAAALATSGRRTEQSHEDDASASGKRSRSCRRELREREACFSQLMRRRRRMMHLSPALA